MKVHLAVPCVVYSYFFTEQAFYCVFSLFSLVVLRFVTEEPLNKPALSVNAKERPKGLVFQADSAEFTWLVRNKNKTQLYFFGRPEFNCQVYSILLGNTLNLSVFNACARIDFTKMCRGFLIIRWVAQIFFVGGKKLSYLVRDNSRHPTIFIKFPKTMAS